MYFCVKTYTYNVHSLRGLHNGCQNSPKFFYFLHNWPMYCLSIYTIFYYTLQKYLSIHPIYGAEKYLFEMIDPLSQSLHCACPIGFTIKAYLLCRTRFRQDQVLFQLRLDYVMDVRISLVLSSSYETSHNEVQIVQDQQKYFC